MKMLARKHRANAWRLAMLSRSVRYLAVVVGLLFAGLAPAQSVWTGATDNNFNTAGNWLPAAVPTGAAVFTAGPTNVNPAISSASSLIGMYFLNPGATQYTISNSSAVA